ncbi:uncharacterized protein LOC131597102 [Vicia villosa]|uniref:uncharacterized protein LOC131597102 n=1 Tax=Vicia villosa TaxID=3911 RepID=UPI00273BA980|nr:uncharacterized protein LOC131597102 [Vicia villosa]
MSASFTKSNRPDLSTSPTYANVKGSSSSVNSCISLKSSMFVTVAETAEVVKWLSHRKKRTCMCSPSMHPGSFRCRLHKNSGSAIAQSQKSLYTRRSAMMNSLVRIRGIEEELVRRALVAPIRCPSHKQRRRFDFQPRPSRFSVMSRY